MSDAMITALLALGMAIVHTVGAVWMLWLRAHYRWRNGVRPPDEDSHPTGH